MLRGFTRVKGQPFRLANVLAAPYVLTASATFTRASGATYFDAAGNLITVGNGVPRFAGASGGLLIEPTFTNQITNPACDSPTVGVIGSGGALPLGWSSFVAPAGITLTVQANVTVAGVVYSPVRIQGTPSTTGEITISPSGSGFAAAPGTASIGRVQVFIAAGTKTNLLLARLRGVERLAGAFVRETAQDFLGNLSGSPFPAQLSFTTGAGTDTTQWLISLYGTATGAIDLTVAIGAPNMGPGALFTTPVYPPAGTQAISTRAVDQLTFPLSSLGIGASGAGTYIVRGQIAGDGGAYPRILSIHDGTLNNEIAVYYNAGIAVLQRNTAGVVGGFQALGNLSANTDFTVAVTVDGAGNAWGSLNGAAAPAATTGCPTSGLTTFQPAGSAATFNVATLSGLRIGWRPYVVSTGTLPAMSV